MAVSMVSVPMRSAATAVPHGLIALVAVEAAG